MSLQGIKVINITRVRAGVSEMWHMVGNPNASLTETQICWLLGPEVDVFFFTDDAHLLHSFMDHFITNCDAYLRESACHQCRAENEEKNVWLCPPTDVVAFHPFHKSSCVSLGRFRLVTLVSNLCCSVTRMSPVSIWSFLVAYKHTCAPFSGSNRPATFTQIHSIKSNKIF